MNSFRKLPQFFSLTAVIVSTIMAIVKGITPIGAVCRIVPAALSFYILGFCIYLLLNKDPEEKPQNEARIDKIADADEEFEELDFPVVETARQDVLGRG